MTEHTITRIWRGVIRASNQDEYVEYIEATGMVEYRATPGNLSAVILTREVGESRVEVLTVSTWTSMEAIEGFAGEDVARAVFYPEDDHFLVERDTEVRHFRTWIADTAGRAVGGER